MTLFVDASFCDRTGAAGWGAWAIRDDWGKGAFTGGTIKLADYRISSSTTAEIAGIALALWRLKAAGSLAGLHTLMIQCDNVAALAYIFQHVPNSTINYGPKSRENKSQHIRDKHKVRSPVVKKVLQTIRETVKGITIELRHVKGHQDPSSGGRAWVNHQCDREADRHMRALRKEIDDLEKHGYSRPELLHEKDRGAE